MGKVEHNLMRAASANYSFLVTHPVITGIIQTFLLCCCLYSDSGFAILSGDKVFVLSMYFLLETVLGLHRAATVSPQSSVKQQEDTSEQKELNSPGTEFLNS